MNYREELVAFLQCYRSITEEKAKEVLLEAETLFKGGWGGQDYRNFAVLYKKAIKPLYDDDNDHMLFEAYQMHTPIDFLRMISYPIPGLETLGKIIGFMGTLKDVVLVDYGCGLAPRTLSLSLYLKKMGVAVKMVCVDLYRPLHTAFLEFICKRYDIDFDFIDVNLKNPYPKLPKHDYCDMVDVLEHLRYPLLALQNVHESLKEGGLIYALLINASLELTHICPNLELVRNQLSDWNYEILVPGSPTLLRKRSQT